MCSATISVWRNLWVQSTSQAAFFQPFSPCLSIGTARTCALVISYYSIHSLFVYLFVCLFVCFFYLTITSNNPHTIKSNQSHHNKTLLSILLLFRSLNKLQFALVVNLTRILMKKVMKMRTDEMGEKIFLFPFF